MPLHLEAITKKDTMEAISAAMKKIETCKSIWGKKGGKYVLFKEDICDCKDNEKIGEFIYTLKLDEEGYTLLDLDITVKNISDVTLRFDELLEGSSDANEYYNVEYNDSIFQVETVNRHMLSDKDLTLKKHTVNLCAFPFKLNFYKTIQEVSEQFGLNKELEIPQVGKKIVTIADDFMASSDLFMSDPDSMETFSAVVGKVVKLKYVDIDFFGEKETCIILDIKTHVGNLATIIGKDIFDISEMKVGNYVFMCADIKADFNINNKYGQI